MVWLFRFYWLVFQSWTGFSNSAGGLVVHASTSPTKRLAWDTDITGDVQWRTCQFSEMGRGSTQEPPWRPIETYGFCTVVATWIYFGHLRMVQLHQNCLQSKGVESILLTEFHAGSTNFSCQVLLNCLCTWDAFHNRNSQWCFWASVSFLLCTSSWQEPFGESLSRLTIDSKTMSEFTLLN